MMNANVAVPKSGHQRLAGLDALRGLAAVAVVLFHYTTGYQRFFDSSGSHPLFTLPSGCFGVQLFFCISGFVICSLAAFFPEPTFTPGVHPSAARKYPSRRLNCNRRPKSFRASHHSGGQRHSLGPR